MHETDSSSEPRRDFLATISAIVVGALATMGPLVVSATALVDPLRRRETSDAMVLVTKVSAIPEDGTPEKFTVRMDRVDAWATDANSPVGAVYLRRVGSTVTALNVVCPHAGCFVGLMDDRSGFACPCHRSSFDLEGAVNDPSSPSPRDLDALEVEVRNEDEVWVRFQNFLPGREEKVSV
ncbi:MAG: Rieske 2Fe-2S domain-containing protein [Gemmatimonadota bacterium]